MERSSNTLSADLEAEIKKSHIAASVHEGVRMLLGQQILQRPNLGHEPEQVVVAACMRPLVNGPSTSPPVGITDTARKLALPTDPHARTRLMSAARGP